MPGLWKRFLGKVGKHYYWWKTNKTSALMFTVTILECIKTLIELNNEDMVEAMSQSFDIGSLVGKEVVSELLAPIKYIGLSEIMAKDNLEELTFLIKLAWYIFLNEEIDDIEYFPPQGDQPHRVVWKLEDCMFCKILENETDYEFNQNTLRTAETRYTYGTPVCGAVAGILNEVLDYVNSGYRCEVFETKCIHSGDGSPEFTAYFTKIE
jgi:hypothetical protein